MGNKGIKRSTSSSPKRDSRVAADGRRDAVADEPRDAGGGLGCFTMRTPVRIRTGFLTATPVDSKQEELRGLQYLIGLD